YACRLVADLVTGIAAVGLQEAQPLTLVSQRRGNAVAGGPRTREEAGVWNLEHRVPIDGGIIFCGRRFIGSCYRTDVHGLAEIALGFGGVHQAIAARPHGVASSRQIGNEITSL